MTEQSLITVMFCCNEYSGRFSGLVSNIEIGELIQLEGPSELVQPDGSRCMELVATTPFEVGGTTAKVGTFEFPHRGRGRLVSNVLWDSLAMEPDAVLALLNYLKSTGEWDCDAAEESLFERWREDAALTMDELTAAGLGVER